jgi:hypothetical protein
LNTGESSISGPSADQTRDRTVRVASATGRNSRTRFIRLGGNGSATTSRSRSDAGVAAPRAHDPKTASATSRSP